MPLTAEPPPAVSSSTRTVPLAKPEKYFHTVAAVVLIAAMLTGFHHFYFEGRAYPGREITPPIRRLVILHGSAMAAWMLVFLLQPLLILGNNRKLHRKVGTAGAVIAGCAVLLGIKLAVESARVKPPQMLQYGLTPNQFMSIPFLSILMFGACVAAAVDYRRNPAIHRTLMLVGTLSAITAALARIESLGKIFAGTIFERIWGIYFTTLLCAVLLLALKSMLARKLDRTLAMGCIGLALFFAFDVQIATTAGWSGIADFLLRVMA